MIRIAWVLVHLVTFICLIGCQDDSKKTTPPSESNLTVSKDTVRLQGNPNVALAIQPEDTTEITQPASSDFGEIVRTTWLTMHELPGSDEYFPQRGMRDFYKKLSTKISYELLQTLSGEPVFVEGPHDAARLNLYADSSFGHYNPEFVQWLADNAIPVAEDERIQQQLQGAYDAYMKPLARTYLFALSITQSHPSFLEEQSQNYLAHIERAKTENEEAFYYSFVYFMENEPGWGYEASAKAIAFWLRRYIDGTIDIFGDALIKLMLTYDAHYYHTVFGQNEGQDQGQWMPFYETRSVQLPDTLSLYLAYSDAEEGADWSVAERIHVFSESKNRCEGTLASLSDVVDEQCCDEASEFVVGHYTFEDSCLANGQPDLILPAGAEHLAFIDYAKQVENPERWVDTTFVVPSANRSFAIQNGMDETNLWAYRWVTNPDGTIVLEMKGTYASSVVAPGVDDCRYDAYKNIEMLYCEVSSYRWSLVLEDATLVYAHSEQLGMDGYSPFTYIKKEIVAVYEAREGIALAFRPGFVVHKTGPQWGQQHRPPLLYYGECDCVE